MKLGRRLAYSTNKIRHVSWQTTVLCLLGLVLCVTQVERYVSQGTILGYSTKRAKLTAGATTGLSTSTQVSGAKGAASQTTTPGKAATTQQSLVCTKLTADKISDILKVKIDKAQSFLPDQSGASSLSYCNYRSVVDAKLKPSVRTASVLYRSYNTSNEVTNATALAAKRGQKIDARPFADTAYYSDTLHQLTAQKGKKVLIITVSQPAEGKIASRDAAIAIAKSGLLN